ncbi:MAG: amylo-alpha-1,6-glucosidase [Tannerella sp.]|jgi:glycogen debranching enzyme|nr:amylo-alpha-1,6-glucosidase [Tannerella sp.]
MKRNNLFLISCLVSVSLVGCKTGETQDTYGNPYFAGVSNHGQSTDNPYLTAGDRAYVVGSQDGLFPDVGFHLRGEMGGIWVLPIKLADGFWLKLSDTATKEEFWLTKADTFINYPYGNQFVYNSILNGIKVNRTQYVPEGKTGVVIQYSFENTSQTARNLGLDFVVKPEIIPVWFSKQNGIIDGADTIRRDEQSGLFCAGDISNNWHVVWGTNAKTEGYNLNSSIPEETRGNGKTPALNSLLALKPGEKSVIHYFICGSTESEDDAKAVFADLSQNKDALLAQKKALYHSILDRAQIEIPDKLLQETYNWVKINTQWLVSDLKGIGRFLGAGAVDYPWLFGCDMSFSTQGLLATSDFELTKSTLLLLKDISEKVNGNGQIIHEMSANGFVYNTGNTQETGHFIMAAWKYFLWSGDIDFMREVYPYCKKGIQWLTVDMDTNHNLFPEGYGITEINYMDAELIDVAAYTEQALEVIAKMALLFDEPALAADFQSRAEVLKDKINTYLWDDEESTYYDFYGTQEQAMKLAKTSLDYISKKDDLPQYKARKEYYNSLVNRLAKIPAGTEGGWTTHKISAANTPIEVGIAPREKAIRFLDKIRNEQCGEYGPYLSVDRNTQMTSNNGVQAMSEAAYGRTDEMLWYVNGIARSLHKTLPGSINEMMPETVFDPPTSMFPYGCPVQAWTIYGVATSIITHIFGVQPDAYQHQVLFEPHLPTGWDKISLTNLRVGDNIFSVKITREAGKTVYDITSKDDLWYYTLLPMEKSAKEYKLNGQTGCLLPDGIQLSGKHNQVIIQ